jgi:predicted nucleic acid-binding protein
MTPAVFGDTFYFLAFLNEKDDQQKRAAALTNSLRGQSVTTAWVMTELADGLADTPGRSLFRPFLAQFQSDPRGVVIPFSQELFERGADLYDHRPDKEWSLTDCISFVVMTDHNITEALTGDHHFEQAGFVALGEPNAIPESSISARF